MIIRSMSGQLLVINYSARVYMVDGRGKYQIEVGNLDNLSISTITLACYSSKSERDKAFEKLIKAICHDSPFDFIQAQTTSAVETESDIPSVDISSDDLPF